MLSVVKCGMRHAFPIVIPAHQDVRLQHVCMKHARSSKLKSQVGGVV